MKKILIAEDEKFIRLGLKTMVQRSGIPVEEILEARDGEEALQILKEQTVDLLMTDIRMPKLDGIGLVEQVRLLPVQPMILVVSGYEDFNYALAMLRNGVSDYLLKPVERQKLCDVLERLETQYLERLQQESSGTREYQYALRFIMLDREEKTRESMELIGRYADRFFSGGYYAFCGSEGQLDVPEEVLLLRAENHCMVYLVSERLYENIAEKAATGIVGVSELHYGLEELRECYQEAFEDWKQTFFTEAGCYESTAGQVPATTVSAEQLLGLVSFSRDDEIVQTIDAQAKKVADGEMEPEAFARLCSEFIQELCSTYKSMIEEANTPVRFANVWEFDSVKHYMKELSDWLREFCNKVTEEFADYEKKQKIREAVQYVQENYCKPLNMAMVSNQVSMNYSLFSILFKQFTGANFINYLQNLRIEEAKRLLASTELRVGEICKKVGFGDEKHFLKLFKASVGLSPTEYRKSYLRQESMTEDKGNL